MAKISGIYVEIRGDSTQLRKDLATAKQHVAEQATGMSNALNNALSPAQLKNNINGIVRNLNTLSQASKLTGKEFGAIGADLKDMQRLTGITAAEFGKLQSRMLERSSANAQAKALKGIADAAGLAESEIKSLAKQMNVGEAALSKILPPAKEVVAELSRMQKSVNQVAASFSNLSKGAGLGSISTPLAELAANSRLSASELTKLQGKLASVQSAKAQEQAIRSIGAATGMTAAEMAALGHKMGVSASVMKSLVASARPVTQELSAAQREVNSFAASLNTLKGGKSGLGDVAQSLSVLASKSGLADTELRKLQARLIQTQASNAQEKALRDIGRAAGMTTDEMVRLGRQMGVSASVLDRLTAEANKTKRAVASIDDSAKSSSASMTMLGNAAKTALGFMSVYTVIEFGRAIMDAGLAMDSLQRSFVAVTGSQSAAAETLSFLREEAGRLGQNFYALAPEFKNVMAAARGTAMEGENVRKMFSAIAGASTALGLSADDTHGTLRALQQMMSKGKIQAEELRGQLGERLPGALNLMAKAMGVSTAELNKMMEDGKLLADEALPKLTREIERLYGAAAETAALESGQAAVNRLSQEWTDLKTNLYDNDAFVAAANGIRMIITATNKMLGDWSVQEQLVNAQRELAGLEQIDGSALSSFPGFASKLENTRKEVDRLKDALVQIENPARDSFLAMESGAEKASTRASQYLQEIGKADETLKRLSQTERQKIDEQYNALKGKVSDSAALNKWYADEIAKLNEKETKKYASELKKQVKEAESAAKEKARLAKQFAEETQKNNAVLDKYWEDYSDRQVQAVADALEQEQKLREKAAEDALKLAEKQAEEQAEAAQKVMDRIQEGTADVFFDLFQNIDDGWNTLWESMKNWALRTIAEIAAKAATSQIVVPILMSLTGAGTANAAMTALTGGTGTGGFSLSSLSGLVSPGSLLSKIPGMGAVSSILGSNLPGTATTLIAPGGQAATFGGLSLGSALGMGAMGGLGYSLLGGALGLQQNQWSGITSSLGGSLGAWGGTALGSAIGGAAAGSVLPVVGTIAGALLGGLASSIFGGDEQSPSVIFQKNQTAWGQTDGYQFHTKDGASWDTGTQIAGALGQVAGTTFDQVETLLNAIGSGYVDQLKDATVTWGRHASDTFGWDFGSDHDFEAVFAQASEDLVKRIYEAAAPVLSKAGADYLGSQSVTDAYSLMTDGAGKFKEITDIIAAGVQSGDLETYSQQLQAFSAAIATVNSTWESVSSASGELVSPLTAYEQAQRAINAQYDAWIDQLESLGIAQTQLTQIESDRAAVLAEAARQNTESIDAIVRAAFEAANPLTDLEQGQRQINDQYDAWIDQLDALGAAQEKIIAVEQMRAESLDALQAKMQASIAAAQAAQVGTIRQAQADVAGTADQYALSQIADRYGWGSAYMDNGKINRENVERDAIQWFTNATTAQVQAGAAFHDVTVDQLISDIKYLDQYFEKLDSASVQVATSYDRASTAVDKTTDRLGDLAAALAEYRQSLIVGQDSALPLSARLAAAQAEYDRVSRLALAGDQDAAGNLSSVANQWLELSKESAKTQEDYGRTFGDVLRRVDIIVGKLSGENVPGFAAGGFFPGGLRIVGENGPEMEATGPSHIWSASETRALLSGGDSGAAAEIRALREEVRAIGSALARNTMDTAKMLKRWDNGMPEVRA